MLDARRVANAPEVGLVALVAAALCHAWGRLHARHELPHQLREVWKGMRRLHGDARTGKHHKPVLFDGLRQNVWNLDTVYPHVHLVVTRCSPPC